jgi:UDP-glucose 4-epimerase
MKKILITGVGGYIASNAAYAFLKEGYRVIGIDNFSTGFRQPIDLLAKEFEGKFSFYQADLTDPAPITDLFEEEDKIDAVIHFAASCSVNESMEDPGKYFTNNVQCTLNLLELMQRYGVRDIVFSSTSSIYGTPDELPVVESAPPKPGSPYAESKYMAERMIKWYGEIYDIHFAILRYFNVCGASDDGKIGDSKKPSIHLVQNVVRAALKLEQFKLTCGTVDTPDKTPIRDYINVVDLAEAHMAAYGYLKDDGKSDIFNVGTGSGYSVLQIVEAVKKITGAEFDLTPGEPRKGESAKVYADTSKAKRVLKWKAKRNLEDSVKSLVAWYGERPNGWDE